ncbi:MAG: ATP-dependent Clp protease proteolytic subunit, partial [Candidatus Micrarchaeaceae archaeon]
MNIPALQLPLGQQPRPPAFISFSAEIVPQTTEALIAALTNFVNQGFRDINLLLSTPGGSVMHGITIYNVLRGLPITLTTHNVGNVDSIGAVIYLAGERRYACPQSTFML